MLDEGLQDVIRNLGHQPDWNRPHRRPKPPQMLRGPPELSRSLARDGDIDAEIVEIEVAGGFTDDELAGDVPDVSADDRAEVELLASSLKFANTVGNFLQMFPDDILPGVDFGL